MNGGNEESERGRLAGEHRRRWLWLGSVAAALLGLGTGFVLSEAFIETDDGRSHCAEVLVPVYRLEPSENSLPPGDRLNLAGQLLTEHPECFPTFEVPSEEIPRNSTP